MTERSTPEYAPRARIILHPTDFSPESERAFAHALRLTIANQGFLSLMHVGGRDDEQDAHDFPAVRETLQRWGLLEPGAPRSAVQKLGIGVQKVVHTGGDVEDAIEKVLRDRPVQMLVMASEGREGIARIFSPSVAERAAEHLGLPTLFVPARGRDCVSLEDGSVRAERILVPVSHELDPGPAIERAVRIMDGFGSEQAKVTLLHVGDEFPEIPNFASQWPIERMTRKGDPATEIDAVAKEISADLIMLVSEGQQGLLERLLGSTSQRVVRRAPCPVLMIPFDWY